MYTIKCLILHNNTYIIIVKLKLGNIPAYHFRKLKNFDIENFLNELELFTNLITN